MQNEKRMSYQKGAKDILADFTIDGVLDIDELAGAAQNSARQSALQMQSFGQKVMALLFVLIPKAKKVERLEQELKNLSLRVTALEGR